MESSEGVREPLIVRWDPNVSVGICVPLLLASLLPSMLLIAVHLYFYVNPAVQRFMVRLIFLVPVFGVFNFISFCEIRVGLWLEILLDLYEAYSLYCFYSLLVAWCGDLRCLTTCLKDNIPPKTKLIACVYIPTPSIKKLVITVMLAITQFLLVKPILSFFSAILDLVGLLDRLQTIFRICDIFSFLIAMFSLLVFYRSLAPCLVGLRTVLIFTWLKGFLLIVVVQSFIVNLLVNQGVIAPWDDLDSDVRGQRLFSFLILIELVFFGIAAWFVFSPLPFRTRKMLGELDEELNTLNKGYQRCCFGVYDALIKMWDCQGKGCWHGANMPTVAFKPTAKALPQTNFPLPSPDMTRDTY
eukprot:TRINITY_DN9_c0_g2_i1.p1 TRINITY_DN9_c0_g2~~TRINITY_DN9_c0_g2_i1.p1  ORF type:complete len:363 (+),score=94.55 TRINITY_DN9_c0_g2_i1:22-1089(+)